MTFYPLNRQLPETLTTDAFILQPLQPDFAEMDYQAMLDRWEVQDYIGGGGEFSWEKNLDALERHKREHNERKAFAFAVLNPAQTRYFGCVYISPLFEQVKEQLNSAMLVGAGDVAAAIRFWVRDSRYEDGLSKRLILALAKWFDEQWEFTSYMFHTSVEDQRQIQDYKELGFVPSYKLERSYGLFFEKPPA